jgi:hypothetical protein
MLLMHAFSASKVRLADSTACTLSEPDFRVPASRKRDDKETPKASLVKTGDTMIVYCRQICTTPGGGALHEVQKNGSPGGDGPWPFPWCGVWSGVEVDATQCDHDRG